MKKLETLTKKLFEKPVCLTVGWLPLKSTLLLSIQKVVKIVFPYKVSDNPTYKIRKTNFSSMRRIGELEEIDP